MSITKLHEHDVVDAEVIEASEAPEELTEEETLTRAEAELLTTQIRTSLHHAQELIVLAWTRRAWESLGYASWNEYVGGEFADISLRPPLESRQDTVEAMRGAGMSIRAISAATTLSVGTVNKVLSQMKAENPEAEAAPVRGVNGKTYSPTQPERKPATEPEEPEDTASPATAESGELSLSEDLLNMSMDELGIEDFVPRHGPTTGGWDLGALPGLEDEQKPVGEDFDLPAAQALLDQVYAALRHSLEQVADSRFPAEVQSPELVSSVTRSLLISAGLLEKLDLSRDRLPEHGVVVNHLQVAAATLDRVAEHLAGDADE